MTTMLRPTSHVFQVGADHRIEVEHVRATRIPSHLEAAGPDVWLWCEDCERAFRLGDARTSEAGVSCAYSDCLSRWTSGRGRPTAPSWGRRQRRPRPHGGIASQHEFRARILRAESEASRPHGHLAK